MGRRAASEGDAGRDRGVAGTWAPGADGRRVGAGACSEGATGFSGFVDFTCTGETATGLTFVTGRVDTPDTGTTTF